MIGLRIAPEPCNACASLYAPSTGQIIHVFTDFCISLMLASFGQFECILCKLNMQYQVKGDSTVIVKL